MSMAHSLLLPLLAVSGAAVALLMLRLALVRSGTGHRVSVLKPLTGLEDDVERNLNSFARLVGPKYELVLGISDPSDPAFEVARRFVIRHPRVAARIVVTHARETENPKAAQLQQLAAAATGDLVVLSDANVRVAPDYLLRIVEAMDGPQLSAA